jgi:hypothetical protein
MGLFLKSLRCVCESLEINSRKIGLIKCLIRSALQEVNDASAWFEAIQLSSFPNFIFSELDASLISCRRSLLLLRRSSFRLLGSKIQNEMKVLVS